MRRGQHLPARSDKEHMQGVRRGEHLPARSEKERVQGVRRGEHLPARSAKEPVQGVRRGGHLPAQSEKEPVQDVQSRQGRLDAARSRGALDRTHNQSKSDAKPLSIDDQSWQITSNSRLCRKSELTLFENSISVLMKPRTTQSAIATPPYPHAKVGTTTT